MNWDSSARGGGGGEGRSSSSLYAHSRLPSSAGSNPFPASREISPQVVAWQMPTVPTQIKGDRNSGTLGHQFCLTETLSMTVGSTQDHPSVALMRAHAGGRSGSRCYKTSRHARLSA
ncbi:hypothetical protein CRG98_002324 [Punica granatum]|uniref:Uncharacterized protein n=1 Tax=Punica granatum TaxID=22663 RepID=A0A2I0L9L6_PUNGR|nr:hypothetical protein CRG98_002324 [Punica granatum]